jgi:hypothetical protein
VHEGGHGRAGATALDERLAATVAPSARTVLVVGPGADRLAGVLAGRRPAPTVHVVDLDGDEPLLEAGSIDCIVYDDVLTRAADPLATLRRQRHLLSPTGTISCSVPNLQHHRVVSGLVRGVFPYTEGTLLDPAYRHLFTSASAVQMLLDAGYAPDTVDRIGDGGDAADAVAVAGAPLFELLGVGTKDADTDLSTSWMVLRGVPVPEPEPDDEVPLTFVACVNDDDQLGANLARSPCLRSGGPHELLVFRGCASAAEGLNAGIEQARHEFVVLVHQDVYLPERWPARMVAQWRRAERAGGPVGIGGVFGVLDRRVPFDAIGRVVHRDRLLSHRSLPADVDGLDELLMVVPRHTPLRVDADLGWHLYGTDLALQAQQRDLRVVVLDAPCHHNSLTGRVPSKYRHSERVLARKWEKMLPIHTNLSSIGSWLVEEADTDTAPDGADGAAGVAAPGAPAVAELVARLRREQVELGTELEQARLQVASMQASPFWRAREVYAALRSRLRPRR